MNADDVLDEGLLFDDESCAVDIYRDYWMKIVRNNKAGRRWKDNPWVWVVKFRWLRRGLPKK
jgi:hypothetical protein